ncbi:3-isopropylmalate dehydratase large subunit, chloroplastic [Trifolium repens]|nr:3-isopropylmalate dehydratase large subunit, chloroplastic [Trifolium repens]
MIEANPDYKGVCHVALAQEGHCRPGEVLLGTDSHTTSAGAFGQFATGVGNTDAAFILGTGKILLKVPPTLRFVLDGKMPNYLLAKDLILNGKTVKVPTFHVPATQKVWMDIYTLEVPGSGGKTCSKIFEEAGCDPPASPSCAACMGGPRDTYGRLNEPKVCVSTTNRNIPGRMGHIKGQVYLASPYTAAASALTGFVTDPRNFL